jgi:lactoylglutathione lyase
LAEKFHFLYTGLRVRNLARSLRFYRGLGFREVYRGKMEHGGVFVHLRFPGSVHEIELNYYPKGNRFYTPFRPGEEFDHFGFFAKDVATWKKRALAAGGKLAREFEESKHRLVYVKDPDGVWLEVFGPKPAPKRPRAKARKR